MRATLAVALLGALIAACFVDRPSEALTCATTADCADNRQCQSGYCVVPQCPSDCTSCDETAKTCLVECASADDCAALVRCPAGWDCTISCTGAGACDDIVCDSGSTCAVTCSGTDACGDVRCSEACACDVACVGDACGSTACPSIGNGANQVRCTIDGTAGAACDSGRASGCTKC